MAKVEDGIFNFRGTIGGMTFRILNGKMVVSRKSSMSGDRLKNDKTYELLRRHDEQKRGVSKAIRPVYDAQKICVRRGCKMLSGAFFRNLTMTKKKMKEGMDVGMETVKAKTAAEATRGTSLSLRKMVETVDFRYLKATKSGYGFSIRIGGEGVRLKDLLKHKAQDAEWVELRFCCQTTTDVWYDKEMKVWDMDKSRLKRDVKWIRIGCEDMNETIDTTIETRIEMEERDDTDCALAMSVCYGRGEDEYIGEYSVCGQV